MTTRTAVDIYVFAPTCGGSVARRPRSGVWRFFRLKEPATASADTEFARPRDETARARDEAVRARDEAAIPRDESARPRDETVGARDETARPRDETASRPRDETSRPRNETARPRDEIARPRDESARPRDEAARPRAKCTMCGAEFVFHASTSSLLKHLLRYLHVPYRLGTGSVRSHRSCRGHQKGFQFVLFKTGCDRILYIEY
jgi:hypothetical protein